MSQQSGLVRLPSSPSISIFYTLSSSLPTTKPIIALSNPLAGSTALWDDFVAAFGTEYTILRYDSRLHGQSTGAPSRLPALTIAELADDVAALLDHLGIEKLDGLIGLSIGAAVALTFGATYPQRVQHVLVVGTKAAADEASNAAFEQRIAFARKHGPAALAKQSVARWFPETWITAHAQTAATVEAIVARQSVEGYAATVGALKTLDLWPVVDRVGKARSGAQFLFVAGEKDGTIPEETRALAQRAASEVVVVRGAGHIVHLEVPEAFYTLVRRWLGAKGETVEEEERL